METQGERMIENSAAPAALLPLDAPVRVIHIQSRGAIFRHVVKRVLPEHWDAFYSRVIAEWQPESGGGMTNTFNTDVAALALYAAVIRSIYGYSVRGGDLPPDFAELVPQHHRIAVGSILASAYVEEMPDESVICVDGTVVSLTAIWDAEPGKDGEMAGFSGLQHRFRVPNADHRRRVLKARTRSFVPGGSRKGVTVIPSSHAALIRVYDELIESVEGYGLSGRQSLRREEIVREMDVSHKVAAAGALFPANLTGREAGAA